MTSTPDTNANDLSDLTFEKALAELEQIVSKLERGDVPLQESIDIYVRGETLKAHCEQLLAKAEAKVETIQLKAEGQPTSTKPMDLL